MTWNDHDRAHSRQYVYQSPIFKTSDLVEYSGYPAYSPSPNSSPRSLRWNNTKGMDEMIQVSRPPNVYYRPVTAPISPADFQALQAMTIASGWNFGRISTWINEVSTGQRLMWFIYLSDPIPSAFHGAYAAQSTSHMSGNGTQGSPGNSAYHVGYTYSHSPMAVASTGSPYHGHQHTVSTPGSTSSHSSGQSVPAAYGSAPSPTSGAIVNHGLDYPVQHPYMHSVSPGYTSNGYAINNGTAPPIGMVCLSLSNSTDPSLASFSQTGRCEICSLFVYSAYRHLGIGAAAMANMESRARMMGALAVTLNTPAVDRLLRRYGAMGYREYKARSRMYSAAEVQGAGLPADYEVAAFLEKRLD